MPAGFSKVYDKFEDPDGAWVGTGAIAFSFMYSTAVVGSDVRLTPRDLVDPWNGRIASSYPQDDGAVLYPYALYARTYGWHWVARNPALPVGRTLAEPLLTGSPLSRQEVHDRIADLVRGVGLPADAVRPAATRVHPATGGGRARLGPGQLRRKRRRQRTKAEAIAG